MTSTEKKPQAKVLVVSVSGSVRQFLGSVVEQRGRAVTKVRNIAFAVEFMLHQDVDLVLVDLHLEGSLDLMVEAKQRQPNVCLLGIARHDTNPVIVLGALQLGGMLNCLVIPEDGLGVVSEFTRGLFADIIDSGLESIKVACPQCKGEGTVQRFPGKETP